MSVYLIIIGILSGLILGFQSCTIKPVVQIGDYPITQKMIAYRDKVAKVYYPKEPTLVGRKQLMDAFTFAQILKNHGRPVTEIDLDQEEFRIERETKDPETLSKLKSIFGKDHESYRQVFILVNFVEHVLYYDFFLNSAEAHSSARAKAQAFFSDASKNPAQFIALAHAQGVKGTAELTVSLKQGLNWKPYDSDKKSPLERSALAQPALIDQSQKSVTQVKVQEMMKGVASEEQTQAAQHWIGDIVPRVKLGQIVPELIDTGEGWLVAKYIEKMATGAYRFLVIEFPKANFDEWLAREAKKIVIKD